jgi:hypothetical protein
MHRRQHIRIAAQCLVMLGVSYGAVAQQPAPANPAGGGRQGGAAPARASRPPLFFREEWKQVPGGGEHPITADAVARRSVGAIADQPGPVGDIALSEVRWLKLDVASVVTKGNFVEKPDLSKVDEVGFADLLPGSGHGAGGWSDVAVIEVYGKPVKRQ